MSNQSHVISLIGALKFLPRATCSIVVHLQKSYQSCPCGDYYKHTKVMLTFTITQQKPLHVYLTSNVQEVLAGVHVGHFCSYVLLRHSTGCLCFISSFFFKLLAGTYLNAELIQTIIIGENLFMGKCCWITLKYCYKKICSYGRFPHEAQSWHLKFITSLLWCSWRLRATGWRALNPVGSRHPHPPGCTRTPGCHSWWPVPCSLSYPVSDNSRNQHVASWWVQYSMLFHLEI